MFHSPKQCPDYSTSSFALELSVSIFDPGTLLSAFLLFDLSSSIYRYPFLCKPSVSRLFFPFIFFCIAILLSLSLSFVSLYVAVVFLSVCLSGSVSLHVQIRFGILSDRY